MFSSNLLVPLDTNPNLPSEFTNGFNLTDKLIEKRLEEYEVFNQLCRDQLKEMTNNKIDMIMARKGIEGWSEINETGNLDALTKSFEFSSFEQASAFVQ